MKTVHVRISADKERRLREIANAVPGATVSGLADRAVELFLEIEGPVYLETYQQTRLKLVSNRERQPVITTKLAAAQ